MLEGEVFELIGSQAILRMNQLELVAPCLQQIAPGLGTDADPVDALGRGKRAVGFQSHRESSEVQVRNERLIELQQRFSSGADNESGTGRGGVIGPCGSNSFGELGGAFVLAASGAVGAEDVGVAEAANGGRSILLPSRPEVAAREPQQDRCAAGVRAFTL